MGNIIGNLIIILLLVLLLITTITIAITITVIVVISCYSRNLKRLLVIWVWGSSYFSCGGLDSVPTLSLRTITRGALGVDWDCFNLVYSIKAAKSLGEATIMTNRRDEYWANISNRRTIFYHYWDRNG